MVTSTFVILGNVKGLSVASEELLRGNILEEHEDALHDAGGGGGGGGHVCLDVPEGVARQHSRRASKRSSCCRRARLG